MLLDALEDGCTTRREIHAHAGTFFLTNNAASDLRRAGIDVQWDRDTDTYSLPPDLLGGREGLTATAPVPLVEETSGQLALVAA